MEERTFGKRGKTVKKGKNREKVAKLGREKERKRKREDMEIAESERVSQIGELSKVERE